VHFKRLLFFSALLAGHVFAQSNSMEEVSGRNETTTAAAEAERRVMEETFGEVMALAGSDSRRGKMFRKAQNEWIQYVKEQAEADADGASGQARYPTAYFQTMRELTRYRTRVLEGCLSRLKAEAAGMGGDVASQGRNDGNSTSGSAVRNWKNEVGDEALSVNPTLYTAEIEGVSGILAGQWKTDELWRGSFIADRGDGMVLYGGRLERGGIVFEAWQEGTRIGRGFIREESGAMKGRFFDERRRESPMVLREHKQPAPATYEVGLTRYSGLIGTEEEEIALEWHDTYFVRGNRGLQARFRGDNFDQGKLFLEEWEGEGEEAKVVAFWSMIKTDSGGNTRWLGQRKAADGSQQAVEFGQ
jgi:uncharacterized protein YecT (DUF1311 family)